MIASIQKVYTRQYRDNGQLVAYVEWTDHRGKTGRTEGAAEFYHGIPVPAGTHIGALFDRAMREGVTVGREVW